jgi:hypothetical protein
MNLTLSDLRNTRWSKSYLWEIQFPAGASYDPKYAYPPDPPLNFRTWFPAYSVQEPVYRVQSMGIGLPSFDFQVPKSVSVDTLSISFYDDVFENIRGWLQEWVWWMFSGVPTKTNSLKPQGGTAVRTLAECVRPILVSRFSERNDNSPIITRQYYIYPSDSLITSLTSESTPFNYTANFQVVAGMFTNVVPKEAATL